MTEKRFTKQEVYDGINRYRINESNFIVEILDDGIPMHYSTIVNRLNEQHKTITRLEKENEQLKSENQRVSEQKHIYKQDWKHLCIDKELLDSENEKLKEDNAILKHALSRIICEFDEHIAKNSEVRDLIK